MSLCRLEVASGKERLCWREGIVLKDLGLFGQLWPHFCSWSASVVELIPEGISDIEYKLIFDFFSGKK